MCIPFGAKGGGLTIMFHTFNKMEKVMDLVFAQQSVLCLHSHDVEGQKGGGTSFRTCAIYYSYSHWCHQHKG